MAKQLIQDIVLSKKRVVRASKEQDPLTKNSLSAKKRENFGNSVSKIEMECQPKKSPLKIVLAKIASVSKSKIILLILAIAIFASGAVTALSQFSTIDVEIIPRGEMTNVDITLKAALDPSKGDLPLEIMKIGRKEKNSAPITGFETANQKASGQIIVYNAYNAQPQSLIKNTRFETPDGKIYRINGVITIPGAKIKNGKMAPGELEITVFADKAGDSYNIGLTDFTIPGFKDTPKYEKFYGRSKTKMEGGFEGKKPVANESDIKNLQTSLRDKIKDYLLKTSNNPKPEEFVLYENAKQINFDDKKEAPTFNKETNLLEYEESAILLGFLLKKSDLNKILVGKYFKPEIASQLEIINLDKLAFVLNNSSADIVTFRVRGQGDFVWKINESKLKNDLLQGRSNPTAVFKSYPAINKAKIVFKPGWWRFMPGKASQINVTQQAISRQ